MKRTAQEIADYVGGELRGDPAVVLDSIASLKNAGPSDLSYAEEKGQNNVNRSHAGCVLLTMRLRWVRPPQVKVLRRS